MNRLVVAGAVVLLPLSLAAPAASAVTVTTQNVKYTLPPAQAHHDINQAAEFSSILFTQEMGLRHARAFAPKGWGTAHAKGVHRGDCATFWDRDRWRLVRWRTFTTSNGSFRNGHRFGLVTVLRDSATEIATICVHMPTGWRTSSQRRIAYADGMANVRAVAHRLVDRYHRVVVGGDWNRIWGRRAPLSGFRTRRPPQGTGHGTIDYFWWHGARFVRQRVIGHTYSDHQGVRLHVDD